MGIPGLLKEIGKGERVALSKLAIEHLQRHNRPLRIAIDAAIWNFQTQSGQGGKNPALRTLFFRLLRLLALPIQPVFVYDGKNKPLTKRGRTVTRYGGTCVPNELSKGLVKKFCYPWHVAPGEAEAECALLQKKGIVDMVMSQDVDAIMFGAKVTLRDWSKEGTRGNKAPTHVNMIELTRLKDMSGLDCDGMILVALLSGGDYDEVGVPGFGTALACEIARAGFGKDLIELVKQEDWQGLKEWRERLQYELETNESGYFKFKRKTLKVPESFPDMKILGFYLYPAVSQDEDFPALEASLNEAWKSEIDVSALRAYTATMFDWCWKSGARRFIRCFAQPIFQDRLRRGNVESASFSVDSISERRHHFVNDGIPELRLSAVPAQVVGIDLDAEEDNPEYVVEQVEDKDDDLHHGNEEAPSLDQINEQASVPESPSKRKKSPPWDPHVLEKWWIPEMLIQYGLPQVVEDWHQLQRDIRADPKKFATRNAAKSSKNSKKIDAGMKSGAIRGFFTHVDKRPNKVVPSKSQEMDLSVSASVPVSQDLYKEDLSYQPTADSASNFTLSSQTAVVEALRRFGPKQNNPTKGNEPNYNPAKDNQLDVFDAIPQSSPDEPNIGSSFSTAIMVGASPIAVTSITTVNEAEDDGRLDHVTHRRSRRTKPQHRNLPSSPPTSPARQRRPIESFFASSTELTEPRDMKRSSVSSTTAAEAASLLKAMGRPEHGSKSTAMARESLPGTWKQNGTDFASDRRAPRVSYVDLTSE